MSPIKRTFRVTIEKTIEIELTPAVFCGMTVEAYLAAFSEGLWPVDDIDDVARYAATLAAQGSSGGDWDGVGLLGEHYMTWPRVPDTKFRVISEDIEAELQNDADQA